MIEFCRAVKFSSETVEQCSAEDCHAMVGIVHRKMLHLAILGNLKGVGSDMRVVAGRLRIIHGQYVRRDKDH